MSVLIKGMQMPEDCFSCPLKEEGFCNITNAYEISTQYYNLVGNMMETPSGLTIVVTRYSDGSVKTEKKLFKWRE